MTRNPPWEYGFYDSEYPDVVYWGTFGGIVGFDSPEMAEHTASKSVWGQAVIVRRRKGSVNWERVSKPVDAERGSGGSSNL